VEIIQLEGSCMVDVNIPAYTPGTAPSVKFTAARVISSTINESLAGARVLNIAEAPANGLAWVTRATNRFARVAHICMCTCNKEQWQQSQ